MSIRKDVTVKITNNNATLDMPLQIYELDHGIELRFKLMDYKYKYTKDPQNILNSSDEDILEAYTTIINPRGYELQQINGEVKDDIVIFMIDSSYTDEIDEIGTYELQIHIKCACSEFSIPPIQFEVLQRLKGIKVVTDGEDEVDNSEILDGSSKFVSDETGKLIIEWKKGDTISSAKLNAMVDVINDAVDEEVIRQANEIERERKAANKIQELENTRVEYVNKFDTELDSFADQVDESMTNYETRFNALTVSQQQDAEVIDARDGEQTLRARLERDIQKPTTIYEEIEGSYINVDTTCGYVRDIEILGNTIQNQNDLADIRSAGDKLENQELYEMPVLIRGKNLFYISKYYEKQMTFNGSSKSTLVAYVKINPNTDYTFVSKYSKSIDVTGHGGIGVYLFETIPQEKDGWFLQQKGRKSIYETQSPKANINKTFNTENYRYLAVYLGVATSADYNHTAILENTQLEEGTQATEYEPYQEDKSTILSLVQLEKVGDIADRIICKNGVWGVEKNVGKYIFKGDEITAEQGTKEDIHLWFWSGAINVLKNKRGVITVIHTKLPHKKAGTHNAGYEAISFNAFGENLLVDTKHETYDEVNEFIRGSQLMYVLETPQFIPLPYDQQIKLRTFANKTNISFECEIEPTLKASVPKSIGASVNTHAEQIDNLYDEIDKIKNLEETTSSKEVVSESDFITVENTSNGYFENVKIEGRTLVNLATFTATSYDWIIYDRVNNVCTFDNPKSAGHALFTLNCMKPNTVYTVIFEVLQITLSRICYDLYPDIFEEFGTVSEPGVIKRKFITPSDISELRAFRYYAGGTHVGNCKLTSPIVLEGDYTDKDISYFEGLKSVGQDVNDIIIATTNAPMFFGKGGKK